MGAGKVSSSQMGSTAHHNFFRLAANDQSTLYLLVLRLVLVEGRRPVGEIEDGVEAAQHPEDGHGDDHAAGNVRHQVVAAEEAKVPVVGGLHVAVNVAARLVDQRKDAGQVVQVVDHAGRVAAHLVVREKKKAASKNSR